MIRVLVVDDQEVVRIGLRALIDNTEDMTCVGEAGDGDTAVSAARRLRPDVVLMDIRMPGVDGLEATKRISADGSLASTKVLVLTTFDLDEYVFEALRHGASGFLVKNTKPAELLEAIRVIADGNALLSPASIGKVVREYVALSSRAVTPHPDLHLLTDREREILGLVGQGLSNDEIAERLVISPATARTHVSRTMMKLGARDRAQLVVFAYQSGLTG